jgi:L-ribulose-5-phosphate 4-epimerase
MNYQTLREEALEANLLIPKRQLAVYTWGNASAFDKSAGVFAIKPSGVPYDELTADAIVVVDLEGKTVEGSLKPSTDTDTHRVLYRSFDGIGGITHAHSPNAVAWAQAAFSVPVLGTTQADYSAVPIPCTPFLRAEQVGGRYEEETGKLIVQTFKDRGLDPLEMEMVLVAGHGPFTWGKTAERSVYSSTVLELVCNMARLTLEIRPDTLQLPPHIIDKHYGRKHGKSAYYGQK